MNFDEKYDRPPTCAMRPTDVIVDAAAALLGQPVRHITSLTGGYRHQNDLLEIGSGNDVRLAVARTTSHNTLKLEAALLRMLESTDVPAPRVLRSTCDINRATDGRPGFDMLILEYIEGVTLAEVEDGFTREQAAAMRDQLIRVLQAIHGIHYPHAGFFDDRLNIPEPFDDYAETVHRYFRQFLASPRLADRLSPATLSRLRAYVDERIRTLSGLQFTPCLVHSDFNQKNIIVRKTDDRWRIVGVIDWEFAHAGCALEDIGNIARFEYEQPQQGYDLTYSEAARVSGRQQVSMWQPGTPRFLDLLAMLEMLTREDDLPKTFATARAVIERTIQSR